MESAVVSEKDYKYFQGGDGKVIRGVVSKDGKTITIVDYMVDKDELLPTAKMFDASLLDSEAGSAQYFQPRTKVPMYVRVLRDTFLMETGIWLWMSIIMYMFTVFLSGFTQSYYTFYFIAIGSTCAAGVLMAATYAAVIFVSQLPKKAPNTVSSEETSAEEWKSMIFGAFLFCFSVFLCVCHLMLTKQNQSVVLEISLLNWSVSMTIMTTLFKIPDGKNIEHWLTALCSLVSVIGIILIYFHTLLFWSSCVSFLVSAAVTAMRIVWIALYASKNNKYSIDEGWMALIDMYTEIISNIAFSKAKKKKQNLTNNDNREDDVNNDATDAAAEKFEATL